MLFFNFIVSKNNKYIWISFSMVSVSTVSIFFLDNKLLYFLFIVFNLRPCIAQINCFMASKKSFCFCVVIVCFQFCVNEITLTLTLSL